MQAPTEHANSIQKGPTQLVDLKTGPSHWKLSQNKKTNKGKNISCYYLILLVSYMHRNMTKNHLDGKLSLVNPWDHHQSGYPFLWLEVQFCFLILSKIQTGGTEYFSAWNPWIPAIVYSNTCHPTWHHRPLASQQHEQHLCNIRQMI